MTTQKRIRRSTAAKKQTPQDRGSGRVRPDTAIVSGLSLLIVGFGVTNYLSPEQQYYREQQAQVTRLNADTVRRNLETQAEREKAAARYEDGCTVLAKEIGPGQYEMLALTKVVPIDQALQAGLAPNEVVCDDNGNTAVLSASGAAEDWARAGDSELIEARLEAAFGWATIKRSNPGL